MSYCVLRRKIGKNRKKRVLKWVIETVRETVAVTVKETVALTVTGRVIETVTATAR